MVLITTGSFAPIHDGHINMMIKAKEKMESEGYEVLAGYFSPDHDEYISSKLGEQAIPIEYRMQFILDKIKSSNLDWLALDAWAGVFAPCSLNFTDVIERLRLYIEKYISDDIEIVFVAGVDNARFANTFLNEGKCVIVGRTSYEQNIKVFHDNLPKDRIFFIEKDDNISSTEVRKNFNWKDSKRKKVIIRMHNDERVMKILPLIYENFDNVKLNWVQDQSDFIFFSNSNIDRLKSWVSLDAEIPLGLNLAVSRNYDFFGGKCLGFINRPNSLPIDSQINQIIKSKIIPTVLFDDDIHTGSTMKFVCKEIKSKIDCNLEFISLTNSDEETEIIDIKDFLYSCENIKNNINSSGLVINGIRKPYLYPFVCPFVRASINNPKEFSMKVWKINADYYQEKKDYKQYSECIKNYYLLKKTICK